MMSTPYLGYRLTCSFQNDTARQALMVGEGIDLPHVQMELSTLFFTLLGWRWLNVAVFKRFTE